MDGWINTIVRAIGKTLSEVKRMFESTVLRNHLRACYAIDLKYTMEV